MTASVKRVAVPMFPIAVKRCCRRPESRQAVALKRNATVLASSTQHCSHPSSAVLAVHLMQHERIPLGVQTNRHPAHR